MHLAIAGVPLAHHDQLDPQRIERWHRTVQGQLVAVNTWLNKKKKHEVSGAALVTQLHCANLQWLGHPHKEFEAWVDKMHKWLKDKLFSDHVWTPP